MREIKPANWHELQIARLLVRYLALKRSGARLPSIWVDNFRMVQGGVAGSGFQDLPTYPMSFRELLEQVETFEMGIRKPVSRESVIAREASA